MAKKKEPLDLSHHFSAMARRRVEGSITPFVQAIGPSVHNLGAGFPFAGNFPNDTLEGALAERNRFPLHPVSPLHLPSSDTDRFTIPKFSGISPGSTDPKDQIDLATALQYQSSTGYPSLAAFIHDWALVHQNQGRIPYKDPGTLINGGAVDGFAKCLMTFADVGDNILVEEFVYFSAKDMILPFGVGLVPVKLDSEGMDPKNLARILDHWDEKKQGKKPHMMYTVTIGQNPTGFVLKLPRRKKIYKLCQDHDILIFEDDPYWSEQYDLPEVPPSELLSSLVPSFLTIDVDGRVLSLQTFTKILAPGFRVGWVVAQPAFIEKLTFLTDGSTSNPSGLSEAVLSQILNRDWGVKGFVRWIDGLRINYQGRRNILSEALAEGRDIFFPTHTASHNGETKEVISGSHKRKQRPELDDEHAKQKARIRVYDFDIPQAGMYIWVRFDFSSHPLSQPPFSLPASKIVILLWRHLVNAPYHLLTIPGTVFAATPDVEKAFDKKNAGFLRVTFAAIEVRNLNTVGEAFIRGVKTFWEGEGWEDESDRITFEDREVGRCEEVRNAVRQYLVARV